MKICSFKHQGAKYIVAEANETAARVAHLAAYVHEAAPHAKGLMLGILPRGDATRHPETAALAQPSKYVLFQPIGTCLVIMHCSGLQDAMRSVAQYISLFVVSNMHESS